MGPAWAPKPILEYLSTELADLAEEMPLPDGRTVRELLAERVDKHPAVAEPRCEDAPSIDAILPLQLI